MSSHPSQGGDPDGFVPEGGMPAEQEPVERAETEDGGRSEGVTEQTEPEKSEPGPESQLPPEAQGEVNGGPLGCCLGVMIGLVLSVSVPLISRLYGDPLIHALGGGWLSLLVRIAMVVVAFVAVLVCGRLGWKIGLRIYREYPMPAWRTNPEPKKKA